MDLKKLKKQYSNKIKLKFNAILKRDLITYHLLRVMLIFQLTFGCKYSLKIVPLFTPSFLVLGIVNPLR